MLKTISLEDVKPADYNPRKLSETAFERLKQSLLKFGVIKPIIIRESDGLILAGHQRTTAMKALEWKECPAFVLSRVNSTDEARFNQLHNFTEAEVTPNMPKIRCNIPENQTGYTYIMPKDIAIIEKGQEAHKVLELSKMILRYGEFGSAVTDYDGNVIISSIYALASKLNNLPLLVYILPRGLEDEARMYFSESYGEFNYDGIKKNTYIQTLAQKNRYRENKKKKGTISKATISRLYERVIIPRIRKDMRILDFGAGKKDYARKLAKEGYKIDAIEFYLRKPNIDVLDVRQIRKDFETICEHIENYGLYDVIICDSVLNSVDTLETERAVLITLSALCKKGGTIYWSGIPLDFMHYRHKAEKTTDVRDLALFLDKNNFVSRYRYGMWFFQHYHTYDDILRLTSSYIGDNIDVYCDKKRITDGKMHESSFQVCAINSRPNSRESMIDALNFEFSLPLPDGKRWDFAPKIIEIMQNYL